MQPDIAPKVMMAWHQVMPLVVREGAGDMMMETFSVLAISKANSSMALGFTPQISAAHSGVLGVPS